MMKAKFVGSGYLSMALLGLVAACGGEGASVGTTNNEIAHALGDLMGAADESLSRSIVVSGAVSALAGGSCYSASYSDCSSNERTLTYDQCVFGPLTLSGEVKFVFSSGSSCTINSNTDFIRRVPNFELVGRSGGKVGVVTYNPTSSGQTVTKTGTSSYSYQVSGVRRYFENSSGTRTVDIAVSTTSAIQISGTTRATRQMTGGTLLVTDNLDGSTVSLTPDSLRWTARCSCPTSGSWIGQKTDASGVVQDFGITLSGCGKAEVTVGADVASITLERCIAL
jgi:hypothetical protein